MQALTITYCADAQAKFRVVYGTQTFSNNNNWLRRKLLEGEALHSVYILSTKVVFDLKLPVYLSSQSRSFFMLWCGCLRLGRTFERMGVHGRPNGVR